MNLKLLICLKIKLLKATVLQPRHITGQNIHYYKMHLYCTSKLHIDLRLKIQLKQAFNPHRIHEYQDLLSHELQHALGQGGDTYSHGTLRLQSVPYGGVAMSHLAHMSMYSYCKKLPKLALAYKI